MPKVEYTPAKGLFQSSGSGIELTQGLAALQQTLSIKVLSEEITFTASTDQDTSAQLPAGAIVLGGSVKVTQAETNNIDIDSVGVAGTATKFGTFTIDCQTAGSEAAAIPTALIPATAAAAVRLTLSGAAAGDDTGKAVVTLYYMDVA